MQADHVAAPVEFRKGDVFPDAPAGVAGTGVAGQHGHAQCPGDAALRLANPAEAQDTQGLTLQFHQGIVPIAEVYAVLPLALVDGLVMVPDMVTDLQQQGDGILADGSGAVAGNVAYRDPQLTGAVCVHNVVARGQHADIAQAGALLQHLAAEGSFVDDDNLRVSDAAQNLSGVSGGAVIDRQLAQLLKGGPTQIAGVFRKSV